MKQFRLVLALIAAATGIAHAQDEEQRRAPPTEIPDFSNLDEYIYEPRSTVIFGARHLSGAKTSFSGQGRVAPPEDPGPLTGANLARVYHDGAVQPDARVVARLDSSGNPIIDPQSGSPVFDAIAPDGKTNTWNFIDDRQVTPEGFIAFHTYSADVIDATTRSQDSGNSFGMELAMSRDMGKVFNSRLSWVITAGVSLNDLSSTMRGGVRANLNALTDFYSLFGHTPPAAPYSAPSSSTGNMLDASGNVLIDESGAVQTVTTDTTVLLGNQPAGRTTVTTTDETSVTNTWQVKGAFFTFRAGPTVWIPITGRFRASVSAGAALVYAGSSYTVTQTFQPELGAEISDTATSAAYKLLPGYYADAALQFDITERAGLYAGAVFQSAGSYTQHVESATASYATKIDLSNQSGLRAGMTIRF